MWRLRRGRRRVTSFIAAWWLGLAGSVASAAPIALEIRAISRADPLLASETGGLASGSGRRSALSSDGRFAVFSTAAPNLLPGFVVRTADVLLYDRLTGTLEALTRDASNPNIGSDAAPSAPLISGDGSTAAFDSRASNLLAGYVASSRQAFLNVRNGSGTLLASRSLGSATVGANGDSWVEAISDDGRYLLFRSTATDLVEGYSGASAHLFVFDASTLEVSLLDHAASRPRAAADAAPVEATISGDGRWVAFTSAATDLVANYVGSGPQLYLRDRAGSITSLVSRAVGTRAAGADAPSETLSLSVTGSVLLFGSRATNLVTPGQNGFSQIYSYDPSIDSTTLRSSSAGSATVGADRGAFLGTVSRDGSRFAFLSDSTNLLPAPLETDDLQVLLFDLSGSERILVSRDFVETGLPGDGPALNLPSLSDDGSLVVYMSSARNLVEGFEGPDSVAQLYAFVAAAGTTLLSHRVGELAAGANDAVATFDVDAPGSVVLFDTAASDLVSQDWNRDTDLFIVDTSGPDRTLVSARHPSLLSARTAAGESHLAEHGALSDDGRFALFESTALDLQPGLSESSERRLFLYDWETDAVRHLGASFPGWTPARVGGDATSERRNLGVSLMDLRRLSSDAGFVGFNLTPPPPSIHPQAFLFDRAEGIERLISHRYDDPSTPCSGDATVWLVSGDGRYAVIWSPAPDLVAGYQGSGYQIYLYDRLSDSSRLISRHHASPLQGGNGSSEPKAISQDGRWVAFSSIANDLIDGYQGFSYQAFVWDAADNSIQVVSHTLGNLLVGSYGGGDPTSMSSDGRFVAFVSMGQDIVGSPAPPIGKQVFVWDRETSTNRMVSHTTRDPLAASDNWNWMPKISRDGRFVTYVTDASDLVAGYVGLGFQVYRYELFGGSNRLVSHAPEAPNHGAAGGAYLPSISADGERIAFLSLPYFAPNGPTGYYQVHLYDAVVDEQTLVSRSIRAGPIATPDDFVRAELSADGRVVGFDRMSDDLVERDWNAAWGGWDTYLARESPPWEIFRDGFASGDASRWSSSAGGE